MLREKVTQLLQEAMDENPALFLISLDIQGNNEIKVTIDGDQGVTVQDCIAVSRKVEHNLDREEEDFSLEVMSVGATTPLQQKRQYKKNIGRSLEVKTTTGAKLEGTLAEATDENVTLTWKAREPKPVGKGKVTVQKTEVIPYENIVEAKVMIKF
ncbi:ribosome maturation factor RimP [Dokdonia pacifica]|uniref:Ribosome maturation factor RimP n=1 Tax=Dokdonia pacifica TaxID=1627892 RepID=A0A238VTZ2_9FLAO|nr:ribosome assembly cofactor RimP [Dokdonia pacifica]GGG18317.1 ribosome maturation factor RimP [Dokdonia pacifica]SNR36959.1 ribosome maturation factor RimP [Dokdonia pacifica]